MRETSLNGRVAWVTGASGALGQAIARMLAAEGAEVFATSRRAEPLEALAAEASGIHALPADVTDAASVTEAARHIAEAASHIDILVNSTTLPIFGPFEDLDDAQWLAVLDAKLMGYVRTMRAVLPAMAAREYGRIVNISGRGGRQPSAAHLPGSCANAAVNLLTKGLADAYGGKNIRINAVAPGPIESERLTRLVEAGRRTNQEEESPGRLRLATPIPRLGQPEEIAEAVLFLVSDRSSYTTGTVLQVDGGGTASL
ncbi:MAG TPA: SDR family oxidoreductase [Stellaceae bacterium]|jgi:NAD(P)-dependent dehydrogenase (short-subunit alcohol dehydrogenase family)|nr:SDR family oxidoreductase [Stellaceae bacterium]